MYLFKSQSSWPRPNLHTDTSCDVIYQYCGEPMSVTLLLWLGDKSFQNSVALTKVPSCKISLMNFVIKNYGPHDPHPQTL